MRTRAAFQMATPRYRKTKELAPMAARRKTTKPSVSNHFRKEVEPPNSKNRYVDDGPLAILKSIRPVVSCLGMCEHYLPYLNDERSMPWISLSLPSSLSMNLRRDSRSLCSMDTSKVTSSGLCVPEASSTAKSNRVASRKLLTVCFSVSFPLGLLVTHWHICDMV